MPKSKSNAVKPLRQHPRYREIGAHRAELSERLAQLKAERFQVGREMRDYAHGGPTNAPVRVRAKRIAELLGSWATETPHDPEPRPDLGDRYRALTDEIDAIEGALAQLLVPMNQVRRDESRLLCEQMRGEHDDLARDIGKSLLAFEASLAAYQDFLRVIDAAGYSTGPLGIVPTLGHFGPGTINALLLKDLKRAGHVQAREIKPGLIV